MYFIIRVGKYHEGLFGLCWNNSHLRTKAFLTLKETIRAAKQLKNSHFNQHYFVIGPDYHGWMQKGRQK